MYGTPALTAMYTTISNNSYTQMLPTFSVLGPPPRSSRPRVSDSLRAVVGLASFCVAPWVVGDHGFLQPEGGSGVCMARRR